MTKHITSPFWFIPAFLLAFAVTANAASSFVIWPMPPRQPGLSDAEYPAFRDYNYFKGFQDHIDKARSALIDLLFDGDEQTCYWQGGGQNVWRERYGSLNAIDFAPQYDRTENFLWRLNQGELDRLHPKLIVLQIGMNNLFTANSPQEIAAGIKLDVDTCRRLCPQSHVLLLGLFPIGATSADPMRPRIKEINQIISKLADGRNVTYVDIGGKLLQPDGRRSTELTGDSNYLSEKGYRVLADAIQPVVDQYCPKSAASPVTPFATPVSGIEPALSWPFPPAPPGLSSASYPVPPLGWIGYFAQNADNLKQNPCNLIFDGDSITEGWRNGGKDAWQERYGSLKAANLGIGGDGVQNVLWRGQHGELDGQNPKLIVLLIGTNNHGQDTKGVAAGIKLILHEYETRCPNSHILLLGIFPNTPHPHSPAREWSAQVNSILATYDDGKRVTYSYIGDKFLQPDGTLTADIMPDFLHPSAKGYTIWADAIQPVVDKYVPKTK